MSDRPMTTEEMFHRLNNLDLLYGQDHGLGKIAQRLLLLQAALDATAQAIDGKSAVKVEPDRYRLTVDPRFKVLQIRVFENSIAASKKAREALAAHEREA